MAVTSPATPLGTPAPDFALPEVTDQRIVTLEEVADGDALVVAFICRHCPYVKHIEDRFAEVAKDLAAKGARFVAISSNDPSVSPDDDPAGLAEQKREVGLDMPYLFDGDGSVARAYGAVCTPDLFVFDARRELVYRGRFDETRPGKGEPTGEDLVAAVEATLAGERPSQDQAPAMGCSIKWTPGTEPEA